MAFSNGSKDDALSDINVTPLVDVMLVLLIIFIVTAPLLNQAVKVQLPETAPTDAAPDEDGLSLSIDANGQIYLGETPTPLEELAGALLREKAANADLRVQLRADDGVDYGRVAKVLAIAQQNGINKIGLVTVEEP